MSHNGIAAQCGARRGRSSGFARPQDQIFSRAEIRLFRQTASQARFSAMAEAYKLFIFQIVSGIKRAGRIDGLTKEDAVLISVLREFSVRFGLTAIVRDVPPVSTVFISKRPKDAKELLRLHGVLIRRSGSALGPRKYQQHRRYGELLGYPPCCVEHFASTPGCRSIWDYFVYMFGAHGDRPGIFSIEPRLNLMASIPLVFHLPCSLECEASLEAANLVLGLYFLYDEEITLRVLSLLRAPVIVFRNNFFVRMTGHLSGDILAYACPDVLDCDAAEGKRKGKGGGYIRETLEAIRRGDRLAFLDNGFRVLKGDTTLRVHLFGAWPYVVLVPSRRDPASAQRRRSRHQRDVRKNQCRPRSHL